MLLFLVASAVFRDGLAGVFTFGAIIAAQVFGFSATEVISSRSRPTSSPASAPSSPGDSTTASAPRRHRGIPRRLIVLGLVDALHRHAQTGFWIVGLGLGLFVGPVQSASRSFLARMTPEGREGEMFGLYATTGRAVSFLAPGLFALFVGATGDTRSASWASC